MSQSKYIEGEWFGYCRVEREIVSIHIVIIGNHLFGDIVVWSIRKKRIFR